MSGIRDLINRTLEDSLPLLLSEDTERGAVAEQDVESATL
jgi:hypothetical protein